MIERLDGEFLEVAGDRVLVNVGGVGLRVLVPRTVTERLEGRGRGILWTRLIVRDGEPQLYGFLTLEERVAFDAVLAVNGVGPRTALAILSFLDPQTLALELERGSTERLLTVPGVGRKLANRILLELKGRLPVSDGPASATDESGPADVAMDAVRALTSLGYPPAEAREAVRVILHGRPSPPPALDELLREALTRLNRRPS